MLNKIKIAVFVSGGGTNLQALIDAQSDIIKSGEIALVVSNKPDVYALKRAENAGIKSAVVVKKGRTQEDFETELLKVLDENNIEMIVLAGFLSILSDCTKAHDCADGLLRQCRGWDCGSPALR